MSKINLKDRIVRLNMEKLMVIISANSIPKETISNLADEFLQDSASSNLMKESTKYDLGASDKTSIISSTLGQSKAQPEETIDLICLEMNNLTCRVDLCPEETELQEEIAQDINKKLGIPTVKAHYELKIYGYNINDNANLNFLYPMNMGIDFCSQVEKIEKNYGLIKYLGIKCSPIELEASINVLLGIWNSKIERIIDVAQQSMSKIQAILGSSHFENENLHNALEVNLSKNTLDYTQIDYVFEFDVNEIYFTILKENRKGKSQWKYLPLCSLEIFNTKLETSMETLIAYTKSTALPDLGRIPENPKIVETTILSKKLQFESILSLNYFNFRLNFYEPFIEKFKLVMKYNSNEENKNISLKVKDIYPLNFNLSTALFENLVVSINYYNEIMVKFGYAKGQKLTPQQRSTIANIEVAQSSYDFRYTLENHTGEDLLVSTGLNSEYLPVYKNQELTLDFGSAKYDEEYKYSKRKDAKDEKQLIVSNSASKSPYRKENFRTQSLFDDRNKNIYLQVPSLEDGESAFDDFDEEKSIVIDIYELQQQKCIKVFIGEDKRSYFL